MQTYIPQPPSLRGDERAQLEQLYRYLYRMSEQLNAALDATDSEYKKVVQVRSGSIADTEQINSQVDAKYRELRSLIIKTADVVNQQMDKIVRQLNSKYEAISYEWGKFTQEIERKIIDTAEATIESFDYSEKIEGIDKTVMDGVTSYAITSLGYIKRGIIGFDDQNFPIYGIAVGTELKEKTVEKDGKSYQQIDMDKDTRKKVEQMLRLSQYENFTGAMQQQVPGSKSTYQDMANFKSDYTQAQLASDVETVTYQDGTQQEIQDAAARLDELVGSGYSERLRRNWSKDPNVRLEAQNAYDAIDQTLAQYYDDTISNYNAQNGYTVSGDPLSSYSDYKTYLSGVDNFLAERNKEEEKRLLLNGKYRDKIQQAKERDNSQISSRDFIGIASGATGGKGTKLQQEVYEYLTQRYGTGIKNGLVDAMMQSHDPYFTNEATEFLKRGDFDRMTAEETANFKALYDDPMQGPDVAFDYLNDLSYFTNKRASDELEEQIYNLGQDGFLGGLAATGLGMAAGFVNSGASIRVGLDRLINGNEDGKYNEYSPELRYAMIHDVALGTVGQAIENATPMLNIGRFNVPKLLYNAATSAVESYINTMSFGYAGAVVMGAGAGGSSYRNNLAKVGSVPGYTEKDAFIDSAFDGFVEAFTEYASVDNLLNPTASAKKNLLRSMWTEPSEEVLGWLMDNGYDTIKYGSKGELAQHYDDLIRQGYTDAEARTAIMQDMAYELTETILVAGLSGGMMGGAQAINTQIENVQTGRQVQSNDNVSSMLDLADTLYVDSETKNLIDRQRAKIANGEAADNAALGQILRASMAQLDEDGQRVLSENAERIAKDTIRENGYDGDKTNLDLLASKVVRLALQNGQSLSALDIRDIANSDAATKAVQALTGKVAKAQEIQEKIGKLDSMRRPKSETRQEAAEAPTMQTSSEATEAFDESVAKADEAVAAAQENSELSAEEERGVRLKSYASEYGANADVMQNAIDEGQNVDEYARAFKAAEMRGEDGQNLDVVKKLSETSVLTESQIKTAYELGRGIRTARNAQLRQNTNYNGEQVQVGNVDTSAIKGRLNASQQRAVSAAKSVAQALGVNIRFAESAANELGAYTSENGSFDAKTMTLTLDVHAGSNSKFNTDYAIMQTLGHELTHYTKSFADSDVWNAYQDFVVGHLSEKLNMDAEIERATALYAERGQNVSRDEAIEEIVANASGQALMNITQEQITQLAQANPTLAQRLKSRVQDWVKKVLDRIRAAYKGGSVKYEVARQMQDVLEEMSEKWNNALVNAAQNRFKGAQQETVQQAEQSSIKSTQNLERNEAKSAKSVQNSAEIEQKAEPQPIAGRHIDQRTTDSVKGVDLDLFSSEDERIQIGFAEAAKILLSDLNATVRGDRTFISDGSADQTVVGQNRMTSELLAQIKDQTGWTWERIANSLQAFVQAGESGELVKNTVTNRTMELYLNEMLTEGYTTLDGVKLTPWGEYTDFVSGLEGAKPHDAREMKDAIPFEEYASANVEEADGVRYSLRDNGDEASSIKEQIQERSDELNEMKPVANVNVTLPTRSNAATLRKWAIDMLKHTGFKVDRKGFGTIEFGEARIKNSLNYLNSRGEIAALVAVPQVLKRGIEAGGHKNHKYRGFPTVTLIAPVEINGVRGNMGVIVKQESKNSYKTHRILMPDGSAFLYNENAETTTARGVAKNSSYASPIISASDSTIASSDADVNGKTKFSLREAVEQTRDLIAVHNLTERNLLDAMNLGGLPSPSIAIVKARDGHSKYGPISIVFDRSSIDPQVDAKNHVYGGDAYTPTDPGVEYPVNYDRMLSVEKRLNQLAAQVAGGIFQNSSVIRSAGVEDTSSKSAEQLAEQLANRDTVRAAYLAEHGGSLEPVMQDRKFSRFGNDTLKAFVEQIGEQELAELNVAIELGEKGEDYAAVENQVRQLIRAWYANEHKSLFDRKPELREKRIDNYMNNNVTAFTIEDFIKNAWEFYQDGGLTKGEIDRMATSDALMERTDERDVTQWLVRQFDGMLGAPGIYNGKERYTPNGNRRSFAQLHYAYTLENIVRAMTENQRQRGEGTWGISATALLSTATPEYSSIDEVRADSNRLQLAGDEDYSKLLKELDGDIDSVIRQVRRQNKPHSDNSFEEGEIIGSVLMEAATGKQTPAAIIKTFSREGYAIDKETAKLIQALYHTAAQFPTGYFEAKPQRAVLFDEVKYAVVPDNMNADLLARLEAAVPDVRTYAAGDETQRLELLNAREDVRFQMRMQDDPNQVSDRELLANALDTVAQNEVERDYLKRYRKQIDTLEQKQAQLNDLNARLNDLRADKASAKANRDLIIRMENNVQTLENSIQRADKRLLDFEATKALKDVLAREKTAWRQSAKQRTDERVARLRAADKAKLQERVDAVRERTKATYERKLAEARQRDAVRAEKRLNKVVDKAAERLQRTEERFEKRIAGMKEAEKRTEYRKRILDDSATMREWLTTPTNKAHVPEFLRAPLGDFLESIDYSSATLLRGGEQTQNDQKLIAAMERMSAALEKVRSQKSGLSQAEEFQGYLDLPSGFKGGFNEIVSNIKAVLENQTGLTDTPLNRMNSEQLRNLSQAIRTLNTAVRQMNALVANSRYRTAKAASESTIEELAKLGERKRQSDLRNTLGNWIDWKSATPYYAFQRFGDGGKSIFSALQDGWDMLAYNVKDVLDFAESAYTPKQSRAWSREVHSIDLSNGNTVQMTTAQLMSLYCLSRRAQGLQHLQGGGIRIADFRSGRSTVTQAENYTLSTADIQRMIGMLNADQIAVADKLQAFMSSVCAEWGNQVSMQRFGYEAFTEENYFPIETDSNNRIAVDESARENDLFRLLNLSATKALVQNANNALVVRDIFDVFAAHTADMAKYNALALPILDTLKWYNYVEKSDAKNGQFTTQSVQKTLEKAYGSEAKRYITEFLRDLNGKKEGGRNDGMINRMISNYKVAAVGANLRVGFLQITSMPRAAYVINPKYLAVGLAKNAGFKYSKIATDNVGISLWKSLGFYDTNVGRNIRDIIKNDTSVTDRVREASMTLAEKGDYWTMGVLYAAVEAEMKAKHGSIQKGTAQYDQMVNERMREIVYKTQVVDSTMTRSDIMRGKGIASVASAFMSEPTLTMNLLSESIYEARMKARAAGSKNVVKAIASNPKFYKALSVTALVCGCSALMEALFTAFRDDDEYETFSKKYRDALIGDVNEENTGWENFQEVWGGSLADNLKLWNNIVFVKDISEALTGDSGDAAMWAAGFGDLYKGVTQLYKVCTGNSSNPAYGAIYTTLKGLSELSGLPASAATRDTIGVYNTIAGEMGWKRVQTYNDKASDAATAIIRADVGGNTQLAEHYLEIAAQHGFVGDKIENAVKNAVQKKYEGGRISEQKAKELLIAYGGKTDEEADEQIVKWQYEKETGLKYSKAKDDYLSGLLDDKTALRFLTEMKGEDKAKETLDRWQFEEANGADANYTKYWRMWAAFEAGSGTYDGTSFRAYAAQWAKITDKKNIASAIAGRYKDEYLAIKGTASGNRMLEKLLDLYVAIGYDRDYERDYITNKWVK